MQKMDSLSQPLDESLQVLRNACPLLKISIYLANCSQGPLADPMRVALEGFMGDWTTIGMYWNVWMEEVERACAALSFPRNQALRLAPHGFTREEELEQAMRAIAMLLHAGQ